MDTKHKARLNRQKHFERGGFWPRGAFDRIWHFIWGCLTGVTKTRGASDRGRLTGGRLACRRLHHHYLGRRPCICFN